MQLCTRSPAAYGGDDPGWLEVTNVMLDKPGSIALASSRAGSCEKLFPNTCASPVD
jgi:hypothetical protein